ncbi:probable GPI-anchored adhesin-like protein PGA55 isoform X11 [Neodiprion lecontei]|uniref:Probable GPI-anchored adhesin-like protein PGA55 isoform X11 n=1 Tax=Neodiprion lecontei TaxID=441921 RepID=A0A6J0C6R8_NEOLC|nr:probable GPI-anchored adhesin-like protein PGA55 isoform X11 [Neodiprion lecontei]
MAEVASKKSINVVSSNKTSEACGVSSNNGLLDLETCITPRSNNQLITLSEEELILANNGCAKNEISVDDKSLQELIESELALRISSTTEMVETGEDAAFEATDYIEGGQPEITKIVLEPRASPRDVNSEFIIAEMNHHNLTEAGLVSENGNFPPDFEFAEVSEARTNKETAGTDIGQSVNAEETTVADVTGQSNATVTQDNLHQEVDGDDRRELEVGQLIPTIVDEAEKEERADSQRTEEFCRLNTESKDSSSRTNELLDTWSNPESSGDTMQIGQFSDNFDESLPQLGSDADSVASRDQNVSVDLLACYPGNTRTVMDPDLIVPVKDSQTDLITEEVSSEQETLQEVGDDVDTLEDPEEAMRNAVKAAAEELVQEIISKSSDLNVERSESFEISSTRDFLEFERKVLREMEEHETRDHGRNVDDHDVFEGETMPVFTITEVVQDLPTKTNDTTVEVIQATEKTPSDNESPRVFTESKYAENCFSEAPDHGEQEFESWTTVEQATEAPKSEEGARVDSVGSNLALTNLPDGLNAQVDLRQLAPLATPDDEISDVSNKCDVHIESREEVITTSSVVTSSTTSGKSTKTTKTKKKKIEGVANSDVSTGLTPRTKKTKKSKKSDPEKENISVNGNIDGSNMRTKISSNYVEKVEQPADEDELSNVNVKTLTQSYVSETNRTELPEKSSVKEIIATGVSIKQLCRSFGDLSNMSDAEVDTFAQEDHEMPESDEKSSFNKFDALSKKPVLHVRSVDAGKVQQQFNSVGQNGEPNPNCRSCGKVVFQMEQTKAEGLIWHKNCFRCNQCSKQLSVDNYQSHEATLYCKPHFKELFQPKPVEESDQPMRPRKPELIIRENQPKELPPDVVRASDKPDLGLEELSALNVKSRFQVFEKTGVETNDIERSPSQVAVKRAPSILSKLAKFQAKGMDIGVADESLNGIPYEESSESEEEEEETDEVDNEIIKAKRSTRERPMSFSKMDDMKNRWESTSQQGRRESQREARKEEIAGIRSRLFMGKQGKMKELYQQAVAESERVTKINAAEEIQEIQQSAHARSIKERFERGEPIAANNDENSEEKFKHQDRAEEDVIAAGISKKSRSLFLELDATAAKTARPVTPKTSTETTRRIRDAFVGRQVSDDVIRSTDTAEEVRAETSDISNKFKFFEAYKAPEKQRRQFRITPPRDGQVKMESPEREIYRDPEVIRADDRVNEVVHTDTARKMLSIFRQMEEKASKEDLPDGPKPLKRFTPPPEDKFAKPTASESEDEEDEEGEESEGVESGEDRDPNYVRASDKVEDEFLKQAQNAARAKTLRAKFEQWETTDEKVTSHHVAEMEIAQGAGDQSSIESASSLRARFESLGSQTPEVPRTAKVKVNRFVEIQTTCAEVCESCEKKVYPLEKVETNNKIFHKQCFRCLQCNCILRMDTFTLNNGKLYCIPHFKQLFITRGNYDEGFGINPHKNKWASSTAGSPAMPLTTNTATPIAVSNGDL